MVTILDDGAVYVGEMSSGQRNGNGTLYLLNDIALGYKVSGNWQNGKLNGYAKITNNNYTEHGVFVDNVKTGFFIREYPDGRQCSLQYENGINVYSHTYCRDAFRKDKTFGYLRLSESQYYLGDLYNGKPFGYGMLYTTNFEKLIVEKTFCEIYGNKIANVFSQNDPQDFLE